MKTLKNILLLLIGISLLAATAEADTVTGQIVWTGSCMAVMGISTLGLNHIEKKEKRYE